MRITLFKGLSKRLFGCYAYVWTEHIYHGYYIAVSWTGRKHVVGAAQKKSDRIQLKDLAKLEKTRKWFRTSFNSASDPKYNPRKGLVK